MRKIKTHAHMTRASGDRWGSEEWIKECRAAHAEICAVNFDSKKVGLSKSNLIKMAYGFWWRNFQPMRMSLLSVLTLMVRAGVYIPSATLLATAQGGVSRKQAEAMWLTVCFPETATKRLMAHVFFSEHHRHDNFVTHYKDWFKPCGPQTHSSGTSNKPRMPC
jgi:hypothetical protein